MSAATIERVVVIGAGTMGHGIAHVAAAAGCAVRLHDVTPEFVTRGMEKIAGNLAVGVEKKKITGEERDRILARIRPAEELSGAVYDADLVVEAAPEDLETKQDLVHAVFAAAPAHLIFATNTSSLPVTEIAAMAKHPAQVIGMHFFNPPHLMPLVEIVIAEQTSPETVESIARLAARMGKEVIRVKDSPGFATSRMGVLLGLEAIRMLESGVATIEDIDRAMEIGYKHPMGPLRLTDLVGLDVRLNIADHLFKEIGEQFRAPPLLRKMVRAGKLGKKTGQGFYKWDSKT
jgi:3-hydroxybutyryl-CoA dehydrogenase